MSPTTSVNGTLRTCLIAPTMSDIEGEPDLEEPPPGGSQATRFSLGQIAAHTRQAGL